jgi:hypothetical protein
MASGLRPFFRAFCSTWSRSLYSNVVFVISAAGCLRDGADAVDVPAVDGGRSEVEPGCATSTRRPGCARGTR